MRDTIGEIVEVAQLKGRRHVFEDRAAAGRALASELKKRVKDAVVAAIPSGGIPVATAIAGELGWSVDVVIVRKLQIPFQPEAGFGAVTMSGHMILNRPLVNALRLTSEDIEVARDHALEEERSRERSLVGDRARVPLNGRTVVLVDDGLASGFTMMAAIGQVREARPERIIVAVPTGSDGAVRMVAEEADTVICLNVRTGRYAVADAYRHWYDLSEEEAVATLHRAA